MLSNKARYAIKALMELSRRSGAGVCGPSCSKDVAKRIDAPLHFVETILFELKRGGLVEGVRGRAGGYRIKLLPEDITFAAIVQAVDGPIGDALDLVRESDPEAQGDPVLDPVLTALRAASLAILEETTLANPRVAFSHVAFGQVEPDESLGKTRAPGRFKEVSAAAILSAN
jgi:Rrf2 family protein